MDVAEKAVIGAILLDSKKFLPQAIIALSVSDFHDCEYGEIFEAACQIDMSGKAFDPVTLEDKLGSACRVKYMEAANFTPSLSTKSFEEYLRIVKEKSQIRQAKAIIAELMDVPPEMSDASHWQEEISRALSKLNTKSMDMSVSTGEGFLRIVEQGSVRKKYYENQNQLYLERMENTYMWQIFFRIKEPIWIL